MRRSQLSFGTAVTFDLMDDALADRFLGEPTTDHWLGGCDRPFGRQSFGLNVYGELVAVAVSASTPNERCGPYSRYEVVELVRLSAQDGHRDMTRVALRLWRKLAGEQWAAAYGTHWPEIVAFVSYQDKTRHKGDIYRFDGWKKVAETKGSRGGGTWSRPRKDASPKAVWAWTLPEPLVTRTEMAA